MTIFLEKIMKSEMAMAEQKLKDNPKLWCTLLIK
jgi:hypothetical protein